MNYIRLAVSRMDTKGSKRRCSSEFVLRCNSRSIHMILLEYGEMWSCDERSIIAYSRTPDGPIFTKHTSLNFGYVAYRRIDAYANDIWSPHYELH